MALERRQGPGGMNGQMSHSLPPAHLAGCPISTGSDPVDDSSCPACRIEAEWVRFAGEILDREGHLAEAEGARVSVASVLRVAKSSPELPPLTVDAGPRMVFRSGAMARFWKPAAAALASAAALLVALDLRGPGTAVPSPVVSADPASPREPALPPAAAGGEAESEGVGPVSGRIPDSETRRGPSEPPDERNLASRSEKPLSGGTPVEFRIEKDSDLVRLTWESRPGERFRVARCPLKSDGPVCARWITIDGDTWTDSAPADDMVVVYRIERVG